MRSGGADAPDAGGRDMRANQLQRSFNSDIGFHGMMFSPFAEDRLKNQQGAIRLEEDRPPLANIRRDTAPAWGAAVVSFSSMESRGVSPAALRRGRVIVPAAMAAL